MMWFVHILTAVSYTHLDVYKRQIESYHVKLFRDAMEEVAAGRADYAVLPIENSTAGIVADIYDLLTEYNLFIVGEQILKVEHVLLGLQEAELSDICLLYTSSSASFSRRRNRACKENGTG